MSAPGRASVAPAGAPGAVRSRVHARLLAEASGPVRVEQLVALVGEEAPLLSARQRTRVVEELLAEVQGLGPLEPLLSDPAVTEVMVNGPDAVWVERAGRLERAPLVLDAPRSSTSSRRWSGRSGCGSTALRRWSTPAYPTAPGSTPWCRP